MTVIKMFTFCKFCRFRPFLIFYILAQLHLLFKDFDLHLIEIGLSAFYLILDHLIFIPQLDPAIAQLSHFHL